MPEQFGNIPGNTLLIQIEQTCHYDIKKPPCLAHQLNIARATSAQYATLILSMNLYYSPTKSIPMAL